MSARLAPSLGLPFAVFLSFLLCSSPARAAPWFDAGQDALEDQFADGDLDEEDHAALRLDRRPGSSDLHGASWVSVVGFERQLLSGRTDVGGIVVVGVAFDRIAAGSVHRIGDPPSPSPAPAPPPEASGSPSATRSEAQALAAPRLARTCVAAAWRTAGLGADDSRIDALISRSRASALLPETRCRAMRLWDDASHATTLATTDDTSYYDA